MRVAALSFWLLLVPYISLSQTPPSQEETLTEEDFRYTVGGLIRVGGSISSEKKKLDTTDSQLTIGIPIPGYKDFQLLMTLDASGMLTKEDGQSTEKTWDADNIIRQFALKYAFAKINGRKVILMLGKMDIPVGLEIKRLGDYTNNPIIERGLTRQHGLVGFMVEVPLNLASQFDSIRASAYASDGASSLDSAAVQLITYATQSLKAVLSVNVRGNKGDVDHSRTVGSVGILYHQEGGALTAWMQGLVVQNLNGRDDGWKTGINMGYAYAPFQSDRLELVAELTAIEGESTSIATGFNYRLTLNTMLSYSLRLIDGDEVMHSISIATFLGDLTVRRAFDPLRSEYQ